MWTLKGVRGSNTTRKLSLALVGGAIFVRTVFAKELSTTSCLPKEEFEARVSEEFPILEPPPKCGVYYYYHVSKNGGTSVMEWQKNVAKLSGSVRYVEYFETSGGRAFTPNVPWNQTLLEMDQIVMTGKLGNDRDSRNWLSVHHHHRTPGLRFMMPTLRRWKEALEEQGCELVLTTTLREPVSRMSSLVHFNHIPREEFEAFVELARESQSYYLLFNTCEPMDGPGVPPTYCDTPAAFTHTQNLSDSEMEELYGYLKEFDLVGRTDQLDALIFWSMVRTGWKLPDGGSGIVPHSLKSEKPYVTDDSMKEFVVQHSKADLLLWTNVFGGSKNEKTTRACDRRNGPFEFLRRWTQRRGLQR